MSISRLWHISFGVLAAAAACFCSAALAGAGATPVPRTSYVVNPSEVRVGPVPATPSSGSPMQCHPGFNCYGPADMHQIYDIPSGPGANGSGQTILVIEAFGNSAVASDLATFDWYFGLPAPPTFTIRGPNGTGDQNDPDVQNWVFETSLDVEWAHAIAPGANIVLVVAHSDDVHAVNDALADALPKYPGAIVSQSFAADETFVKEGFVDDRSSHRIYAGAAALGDTVLAGTGDFGASGFGDTGLVASYPASDPLVTAVGGTEGLPWPNGLWSNGGYGGEQVWNETFPFTAATGGGPSQLFPSPAYQAGL